MRDYIKGLFNESGAITVRSTAIKSKFKKPGQQQMGRDVDGNPIPFFVSDRGISRDGYFYVTRFELRGRVYYSKTPRELAEISGDLLNFRLAEDMAFAEALGVYL